MSRAVLQAMTSTIVDAFVNAGLADVGTYTAPGGSAVNCRVIVDRSKQPFGNFGSVIGDKDHLTLLYAEIAQPLRDAIVVADGDTFKLVNEVNSDAASSTWEVAVL